MFNRFSAIPLASALLAFQLSSVGAEELNQPPFKAPPLVTYDWTGFYLGVHGGYGRSHHPFFSNGFALPFSNITSHGAVYGLYGGYNWQYRSLVFGLETDFSATHIEGSTSNSLMSTTIFPASVYNFTVTTSLQDRFHYMASLRDRAGFLPIPAVFVYATAGPAWATQAKLTPSHQLI